jgi:hypothetical protein
MAMKIEGVRFFLILDKDGSVMDVRLVFTVKAAGLQTALYAFGKKLSKVKQAKALSVIERARTLTRMKEKVKIIGKDPDNPHEQKVTAGFNTIVPNGEGPARILIGKVTKDHFAVRLTIVYKDAEDNIALEVPFKGDPGELKGKAFDGEATFLIDGAQDVAKVMLDIYDIPGS